MPSNFTGSWDGSYGPDGSTYYLNGQQYQNPQDIPGYQNGLLPYGTTSYSPGGWSGMSSWDQSVQNNPNGPLSFPGLSGGAYGTQGVPKRGGPTMSYGPTQTGGPLTDPYNPAAGGGNAPVGGVGGANLGVGNPPGLPAGGNVNFDPFGDASTTVLRALRMMGIDPTAADPATRALLRNANPLYYTALAQQGTNGNLDQFGATKGQSLISAIQSLAQQALHGGQVFGGQGNLLAQLGQTVDKGLGGDSTGASPGERLLASVLGDPSTMTNMISALLYGGAPKTIGASYSAPLAMLPDLYQQGLEQGQYGQKTAAGPRSAIDLLGQLYGNR